MKPAPRNEAMSSSRLPSIMKMTAATTPTKPVKMLITVTSRPWMKNGWASTAAAPASPVVAARAWPISQMPLITSTAPTYSSTTPSIAESSFGVLVREHPRQRRRVPVGQRASAFLRHDVGLVRALLLELERPALGPGDEREARRGEHPSGLVAAARASGSRARLGHRPEELERSAVRAYERVDRHGLNCSSRRLRELPTPGRPGSAARRSRR